MPKNTPILVTGVPGTVGSVGTILCTFCFITRTEVYCMTSFHAFLIKVLGDVFSKREEVHFVALCSFFRLNLVYIITK